MNYNIIKNIIRQELRRINEANEDTSTTDLDKAADAIDEINKLIVDFKPKFDNAIRDLEKYLPVTFEDILTSQDGLLREGDFWVKFTADIDTISAEVEDLMAAEEKGDDPKKIAADIEKQGLVDEYLSLSEDEVDDFYMTSLKMKNPPSAKTEGEVYDTLSKQRKRGYSSEVGG